MEKRVQFLSRQAFRKHFLAAGTVFSWGNSPTGFLQNLHFSARTQSVWRIQFLFILLKTQITKYFRG